MNYYKIEPAACGGFGEGTVIDDSREITSFGYEFEQWEGDAMVYAPIEYIVTSELALDLRANKLTGFKLYDVTVTIDEQAWNLDPEQFSSFPKWLWLKAEDVPNADFCMQTFWYPKNTNLENGHIEELVPVKELVISERAKVILEKHGIPNATVENLQSIPRS